MNDGEDGVYVRADGEYLGQGDRFRLEQGFFHIPIEWKTSGAFTIGRINHPIGYEGVDPTDPLDLAPMIFASHSLLFERGRPSDVDGLGWTLDIDFLKAGAFLDVDEDGLRSWGWHAQVVGADVIKQLRLKILSYLKFGAGGAYNLQDDPAGSTRDNLFSAYLSVHPTDRFNIVLEVDRGSDEVVRGRSDTWWGVNTIARWEVNARLRVAGRWEYVRDEKGLLGLNDTVSALSVAPTVRLLAGPTGEFYKVLEGRMEWRRETLQSTAGFLNGVGAVTDTRNLLTVQLMLSTDRLF
jgi:hypothetical protein